MDIRHTVKRGDCLWSLAHRYLHSGNRYPYIIYFHNKLADNYGLRLIDKPDLIFVGETILIPPRPTIPWQGNGTRTEGSKSAFPLNLKIM